MNLKRIIDVYDIIKDRLPKTYPRPKLAFFEDEDCMLDNNEIKKKKDEMVCAIVSPDTCTISLPLKLTLEYYGPDGQELTKTTPINKNSDDSIALVILHEIGHLYAGRKYGYRSKQYSDEKYCDRFAERWLMVLHKEHLL